MVRNELNPFQLLPSEEGGLSQKNIDKLEAHYHDYDVETCMIYKKDCLIYTFEKNTNQMNDLHKVNSVTKSILSSLIGIAIDKGGISSIDQPVTDFFEIKNGWKNGVDEITIRHLLTMTSGIDARKWKQVINTKDWATAILSDQLQTNPGNKMIYSNSDSHLLSAILHKATKMNPKDFANEYLFKPLNIRNFKWETAPNNLPVGGYGLFLSPLDIMKYAVLILQNGTWEGQKLISKSWIEEATKSHVSTEKPNQSYAYHWWISAPNSTNHSRFFYAAGRGGKFIFIQPEQQLAVTFTADLSDKDSLLPYQWFFRYIL
ncbi:serine hydrolase domain-containing protein [Salipaludibacillus sp. HK11]|uniref:serine hydrolase domain-containing protein n=1 Tax=Salipaludibacillus sp. HK11 TaxID=3394320 RepID=UPI0039FCF8CB